MSSSSSKASSSSDLLLPSPPADPVSAVVFSPLSSTSSTHTSRSTSTPSTSKTTNLLVASWDNFVHHYSIPLKGYDPESTPTQDRPHLVQKFQHEAPVLDVCFVGPHLAATGSLDRRVRLLNLETNQLLICGKHEDAVCKVRYCSQTQLLFSASWDRTVKVWRAVTKAKENKKEDAYSQQIETFELVKTLSMPDKVLAMDVSPSFPNILGQKVHSASHAGLVSVDATPRLVIGMVGRIVYVYDLTPLASAIDRELSGATVDARDFEPDQKRESSLKYMIRDLRCMPAGDGYVTSSIEGRVAVEFFNPNPKEQAKKYAFKCHRQPGSPRRGDEDIVYPVNGIAFHPIHGTFASLGGDGVASIWDGAARKRLRQYPRLDPNSNSHSGLSAGAFDPSGNLLLIATGADDTQSHIESTTGQEPKNPPKITFFHKSTQPQLILKWNIWHECLPKVKSSDAK